MGKIPTSSLQQADVILTTGKGFVSEAIKISTASDVSHAMLYVGDDDIIHAEERGVVQDALETVIAYATKAQVYRHKAVTPAQQDLIISYAHAQKGKKFDYEEMFGAANPFAPSSSVSPVVVGGSVAVMKAYNQISGDREEFFCSELVVAAYQHAGLRMGLLNWNPSTYSPGDISNLITMTYVGDLI